MLCYNFDLYRMLKVEIVGRDGIVMILNVKLGIVEIRCKCEVFYSG